MPRPKRENFFCSNCGHEVDARRAALAADPAIQFCVFCRKKLADGKCRNGSCPFCNQDQPPG